MLYALTGRGKWNEAKQKLWEIKAEDMSCTLIVYMCRSWKEL